MELKIPEQYISPDDKDLTPEEARMMQLDRWHEDLQAKEEDNNTFHVEKAKQDIFDLKKEELAKLGLRPRMAFGDHVTIDEFIKWCTQGYVTDSDGSGYFATQDGLSDIVARPSTLKHSWRPSRYSGPFTHIQWFNK